MRTWTATTTTAAHPAAVLDVLTDPDAFARWAPVAVRRRDARRRRLRAGSRARVSGRLAGPRVGFDVEVHEADERGLALSADGPVGFDVAYELAAGDRRHARSTPPSPSARPAASPAACSPRPPAPCSPPAPSHHALSRIAARGGRLLA